MILVDSSVWIAYFNGLITPETELLDQRLGSEPIALDDLIVAEVLQGFRNEKEFQTAKELLTSLTVFDLLGKEMAIRSANNFRTLRKRDITIRKTADVIIATFCIENDLPLLHLDRDFLPLQSHLGLRSAI